MQSINEEDSDAEEMRRLINYDEESGENEMSDEDSEEGE
jgi:hypothetical protein